MLKIEDERIVELALISLGPQYKDITLDQMECALTRRVALIRAALRPNSTVSHVMESQIISGVIDAVEYEERSNRNIIHFTPTNGGESESIRTCRLETSLGKQVSELARANIGKACYIIKVLEPVKNGNTRVRVAYDIQPLGR